MKKGGNRKLWKLQIACVLSGLLCYGAAELYNRQDNTGIREGYLERNSYGEGGKAYEILVEGLSEEEVALQVEVGERRYTKEEAEEIFQVIHENLGKWILEENNSLWEVRSNLNLLTWLPKYGMKVRWKSENPELIDSFGGVLNENVDEAGTLVMLKAEVTDGIHMAQMKMLTTVCPPILSRKERAVKGLSQNIASLDEKQRSEERLKLPLEYEGESLHYRESGGSDNKILLVLGVLLAVLCYAKDRSVAQKKVKEREQQMLLDYSEIVSKLMVFLGAGMALDTAWERMVMDYEGSDMKRGRRVRFAYEEMCQTHYQIKSGVSKGQAYRDFGMRCKLQPYLKLSSLLEQNRKTGTKNLNGLLQIEMASAFEQRKNLAKRLGEEAGTKLLVPLFLMLGVVMVMIVVPAFLSFYI